MFDLKDALFRFGAIASAIWLLSAGLFLWLCGNWSEPLRPNEYGDLFAGVAAPMAFLWLVLGFLQQGKELRVSSRALMLQVEELKNTVTHQAALVEVTREQVAAQLRQEEEERRARATASQPRFVLAYAGAASGPEGVRYKMRISNVGATATNLRISLQPNSTGSEIFFPTIRQGQEHEFAVRYPSAPATITITIHATDANDAEVTSVFVASIDNGNRLRFQALTGALA